MTTKAGILRRIETVMCEDMWRRGTWWSEVDKATAETAPRFALTVSGQHDHLSYSVIIGRTSSCLPASFTA